MKKLIYKIKRFFGVKIKPTEVIAEASINDIKQALLNQVESVYTSR